MNNRARFGLLVLPILLLALVVTSADLYVWSAIDHFRAPIRALVLGDQDYYQIRVHQTLVSGQLIESPFFIEHTFGHPRFVVFESLILAAGKVFAPIIGINRTAWGNLLRIAMVTALFLEWLYVFRRWASFSAATSVVLALAVNLWQEPFAALVQFALGSWFLPFVFFGLIAAVNGFRETVPKRRWAWHIAASLAFAVHPIAFATGSFAIGLVWLMRFWKERSAKTLATSAAWAIPALVLGVCLFGSFLASHGVDAARVAAETLVRNTHIVTHLPISPLKTVRVLALLILIVLCRRRATDDSSRMAWDVLLAYQIATLIGQNANLVTGTYFINDHFSFAERIAAVMAAAMAWKISQRQPTRGERIMAAFALIGMAANNVGVLVNSPIRSWLVLGSEVPYLIAGLMMAWIVLGRPRLPLPKVTASTAAILLVSVSAAYAFVFVWRLNRGVVAAHALAQDARPVLQELTKLPTGVVLADSWLSGLVAADSADRPYWTPLAFGDEASNQELLSRWRDALAFYPDDPGVSGPTARDGLFGAENHLCNRPAESLLYGPLAKHGILAQSLCRMTMDDETFASFLQVERQKQLAVGGDWKPAYRLDMVVLDAAKGEHLPKALTTMFKHLWSDGRWSIYGFNGR